MSSSDSAATALPWVWDYCPLSRGAWQNCQVSDPVEPGYCLTRTISKSRHMPRDMRVASPTYGQPVTVYHDYSHFLYRPTEGDLAILRRVIPDADEHDPPWPRVQALLESAGRPARDLMQRIAPTLILLLEQAFTAVNPPEPSALASDGGYEWARQVELFRATNQVLGEGTINKGELSRACRNSKIETNGKRGRGLCIRVTSYCTWAAKRWNLPKLEQDQLRNAIVGEVMERNSKRNLPNKVAQS